MIGVVHSDHPSTLGLVVMPTFAGVAGGLVREQTARLKALTDQRLNVDSEFSIVQEVKKDYRDGRPMTINGRICYGLSAQDPCKEGPWSDSYVLTWKRTQPCEQLPSHEMVNLDDYNPSQLPKDDVGTDAKHGDFRGAKRHEQLGPKVCTKILEGVFDSLDTKSGINATLVVDLNICTGDMLYAWIIKTQGLSIPCHFFGLASDECASEWVLNHVAKTLAWSIKNKVITVTGIKAPESVASEEVKKPSMPQLKALVWDESDKVVRVPKEMGTPKVHEWH